eukprot:scaffold6894_cov104-Isochrysis_galbana.AAC.6
MRARLTRRRRKPRSRRVPGALQPTLHPQKEAAYSVDADSLLGQRSDQTYGERVERALARTIQQRRPDVRRTGRDLHNGASFAPVRGAHPLLRLSDGQKRTSHVGPHHIEQVIGAALRARGEVVGPRAENPGVVDQDRERDAAAEGRVCNAEKVDDVLLHSNITAHGAGGAAGGANAAAYRVSRHTVSLIRNDNGVALCSHGLRACSPDATSTAGDDCDATRRACSRHGWHRGVC